MDRVSPRRRRALSALIAISLACLLLIRVEPRPFAEAVRNADWRLILAAAALNLTLNSAARVMRFRALLGPLSAVGHAVSAFELARVVLGTRALNAILPARAGEAFRGTQLLKRHRFPASGVIAAVVVEPVTEAIALAVPAALLLVLPHAGPGALERGLCGTVVLASTLAFGALLLTRIFRLRSSGRLWRALDGILEALHLLNRPGFWGRALAWSWVSDLIDLATIALCLAAVGAHLSFIECFLILLAVNLAILLPVSPGNLGTLEAGAVFAAGALGVERGTALLFALSYHAAHLIPTLLAGLLGFGAPAALNAGRPEEAC